ncbi:MAG: rod shape-determining protein MreD [Gemmatimonadota bacterium]|jgi:rod shape-determining protein MreD
MTSGWRVWIVIVGLILLHLLLHVGLGIGRAAPDLLTLALLAAARELRVDTAAGFGLLLGLLEDALSALSFGANAITMTLIGAGGAETRDLFVGDSILFLVSYFFLGKWLRDLIHWFFVGDTVRLPFVDQVVAQGLVDGAYTAAVGVLLLLATGLWRDAHR